MEIIITVIVLILTISVLVLIHEFGHFITAKKFGVKVLEFGYGIPPMAWGKKVGEMIVSINWLPIGGFVRLLGEDEASKDELEDPADKKDWPTRSFAVKPVWQRMIIAAAGVVMNLLFAFLVYTVLLAAQGFRYEVPMLIPHNFVGVSGTNQEKVVLFDVADNSPAKDAGLQPNEEIVSLNNKPVLNREEFANVLKANAGNPVSITVKDILTGEQKTVSVTPRKNPPAGQGALGVSLSYYKILVYSTPLQKIFSGPIQSWNMLSYSLDVMGTLISSSFRTGDFAAASSGVGGPILIGYYLKTILFQQGAFLKYLDLLAAISLSLGLMNILPIPALDGGRLAPMYIELLTKKKINPQLERKIHATGFVVLIVLIFLIAFKDAYIFLFPSISNLFH